MQFVNTRFLFTRFMAATFFVFAAHFSFARNGLVSSFSYQHIAYRLPIETTGPAIECHVFMGTSAGLNKQKPPVNISVQNLLDTEFNDAQFDTESRLFNEPAPVAELHFTPGTPFFLKGSLSCFF